MEERNEAEYTTYLFNGKELDEETGLYYYGARYYDPRTALWISVDLFAEKYIGLTPYQYGMNNPLKFIDINGDSSVVLLKFGHMAQLIQNKDGLYQLWSKNGTHVSSRLRGPNDISPDRGDNEASPTYKSPQDFFDSKENIDDETGKPIYTEGYLIPASSLQDRQNEEGTKEELSKDYDISKSNCVQTVQNGLRNEGKKDGALSGFSKSGFRIIAKVTT